MDIVLTNAGNGGVKRLYTPWRMKYVTSHQKLTKGCVFCAKFEANVKHDRENLVVFRGDTTFTVMNVYPYNTGHLMVLPQQHVSTLAEVPREAQIEMIILISYFMELLTQVMRSEGFNVGINIGKASGAGLGSHLHAHIVPRWSGDSNFMTVIGHTRVLPELIEDTYDRILTELHENPPQLG